MKKAVLILTTALTATIASAEGEGLVKQFNDLDVGTLSGRLQALSMYRDYDNGANAHSTTLGIKLDYLSPEKEGWTLGASYIGAGVIDSMDYDDVSNPGEALVGNGRVDVLNEGYLKYNMASIGLTNTAAYLGRKVNNGEIFRKDDFRQKPRSLEALVVESSELKNNKIVVGHAWEMSGWVDAGDRWKFEEFDRMDTEGITWGEIVNNCVDGLEVALFDAMAYDLANLVGGRAEWNVSDETTFLAYLRNETDIGDGADHNATAFGLSLQQKVGDIKLEGGYFGVSGDNLKFEEINTGINHALGSSLMIYSGQFNGGADTFYLKAVTKLEETKTTLYALYNYTLHDEEKTNLRQAEEFNVVIKQPCPKLDGVTIAFKGGFGFRDGINSSDDTIATDARLFMTYSF
ncbi:MAG TPA: hypothetical protein VIR63_00515 [Pontiella sp.]